ncbi:putative pentatricopeptide repeat-containing protein At5g08490 [Herrania umbratica]|uniref:Pentatricopeptide repeat-containing protein At5g08490 n=1 Tax=Herrania umbratica TaxID=108875 RepID=A0A6J0ZIR7_9ROSI|nr:putative pentatricopeptide repeat-containing protein At5g08490 [Herrania umbratica]XP_021274760.1 putative pentatricopeptide repeat-containing protein At5g08490 [Herrania umbratica]XP_021274761.1 putative pentatricopeptide repeat-containing protein At5g08490 [Herrania umbratica]
MLGEMLPPGLVSKAWISMLNDCTRHGRHCQALSLFVQKVRCSSSFGLDHQVLAAILKSCAALRTTLFGRALHSCAVKLGHVSCHSVSKALLNMYAKSGALGDCQKLFSQMGTSTSDPVVWNIVLSGLSGYREYNDQVLRLFNSMPVSNEAKPNPVTVAIVLPLYARLGDIDGGNVVHSYVIKSGLDAHTLVGNALISMYAKCGLVKEDAYAVFCSISDKDVVSWNAIIAGFSENNLMDDAFRLFRKMLKGPIAPNDSTIVNILLVCASLDKNVACYLGKEIHCFLQRRTDIGADVSVCNALMSYYLRVGHMDKAELVFQKMESRDLVSWNAIIAGYVANGYWLRALDLFLELLSANMFGPNSVTLVSILSACAHLKDLQVGKVIHGYILRHSCLYADTAVENSLISFYAKCHHIGAAYQTFLMIPWRDLVSWNSILDAFAECEYDARFQELLNFMLGEGLRPDFITFLAILRFCVCVSSLVKVKETHCYCLKAGFLQGNSEPAVINAIIDAYAKCGNMGYASRIFHSFSGRKNLVTFNSMISAYVNSGSYDDAFMIFNGMSVRDLTSWNLMVQACTENDCPGLALSLFHELQAQGMKPDVVTIMSILPVCAQLASVYMLRQCHGFVIRACFQDAHLNGALLDVYAKCGRIWSAHKLFQSTPVKDLVMFTSMIGGYAMHGMGEEALSHFSYMLESGVKPDHVIITAILSACSHAGLADEGLKIFYSLDTAHGMKPSIEHYACIVDLLARGGRINDAYSLVAGMSVEANATVWGTLLGACRTHHEVELGRVVADHLFQIEANNIGNYVVMSNLYAADARWDGVMEVRKLMRTRDLRKPAGCSWIEVEKRNNVFISGDCFHPERKIIYSTLSTLDQQIKEPFLFDKINIFSYGI